jgi:alanine-glyoxylate transaminase/serine-glyoxylate transaminase/serine-pyruvate transaminase
MSLANGRRYLAIPGPSVLPDRVLAAMQRPSPNIYAGELVDMVQGLWPDLKRLVGTSGHVAAYIGNGHAGWEAVDTNLFSRGDRVLVLACGNFGHGWASALRAVGVEVDLLDFGKRTAADPGQVESALRADTAGRIKAVLMTQVDTATSVKSDVKAIRKAIDAAGHPALFCVDCIASLGCDDYRMDEWGVDVTLAASQKGLMTPAGMVFIWFSEKARLAGQGAGLRTPYWNWGPRANPAPGEFWEYWHGTAPTHHLFALRAALDMIFEEGLAQVHQRHARLARAVWAAVEVWGKGNPLIGLNVADPAARAGAVTSIRLGAPDATRLRTWVEAEAGLTLGVGLGMGTPDDPKADGWLRLAHMGHVNAHMTLGALAVVQAGLNALGIPHGTGAVEAAGKAAFA